jgi:hypothetical protein
MRQDCLVPPALYRDRVPVKEPLEVQFEWQDQFEINVRLETVSFQLIGGVRCYSSIDWRFVFVHDV